MKAPADIPVAKTLPRSMPNSWVSRSTSATEEADVVDSLPVGHRGAAPVGPAEVDAVGINHHEPVLIGDGVVVRRRRLLSSGHTGAVQVYHQTVRLFDPGRDMHEVGALKSTDRDPGGKVTAGKRR